MKSINPLDHPICFTKPMRLISSSAWTEHIPFAMFLIDVARPQVLVELGTASGNSYSAFCQAIKQLGVNTQCYAVDTWAGGEHAGFYDSEVLGNLRRHHDPLYGGFSRLVQNTFEDALKYFPDGSIDILHIDGLHTYEAVKHDFESWLPKLSERAVVLFHDVNVREHGFGVWKFWMELKQQYRHFEFFHGHGLGVLQVGKNPIPELDSLFDLTNDQSGAMREFFFSLGSQLSMSLEKRQETAQVSDLRQMLHSLSIQAAEHAQMAQALSVQVVDRDQSIQGLSAQLVENEQASTMQRVSYEQKFSVLETTNAENVSRMGQREQVLQTLNVKLLEIYGSRAWRVMQSLWKVRLVLIPPNGWIDRGVRWLYKLFTASKKAPDFQEQITAEVRSEINPQVQLLETLDAEEMNTGILPEAMIVEHIQNEIDAVHQVLEAVVSDEISVSDNTIPPVASEEIQNLSAPADQVSGNLNVEELHTQMLPPAMTTMVDASLQLSEQLHLASQIRLASVAPKKPMLVNLDEQDLKEAARSLKIVRQEKPEISIIIPVYDQPQLTLECLISIVEQTHAIRYEIVIVDDGSSADTVEILQSIANISLVHHPERLGFTLTCNHGANAARGKYLLFLNNDTQVTNGWLKALLDIFTLYDGVGAVGPKVLFSDGRLQQAGCVINSNGTTNFIGENDDPELPRYNFAHEVDYCSAVSLLMKADIFHDMGGFDEVYSPAYYEDVDLCMKLQTRGLKTYYCPDSVIVHHLNATTDQIGVAQKIEWARRNSQIFTKRWQEAIDDLNRIKLIAFYLPQYHPIPENDLWWGKGFTEWTNVGRALPNYEGHYQPHLPADVGYYDLRLEEVMEQQVELAKKYNIHGFCYYYYWFNGKRMLEMPLERMLETGKPDFPFCLCWANENWSRRWDGSENEILIAQNHSEQDDRAVILDLIRYFRHPSYIRVDGKPILMLYQIDLFPNIQRTAQIWREVCREENVGEIHIVMAESFEHSVESSAPHKFGLDASVEFPPHNMGDPEYVPDTTVHSDFSGMIFNYNTEVLKYVGRELPSHTHYHTVMPAWDNTARKQNRAYIFDQSTPEAYQAWLEASLQKTREHLGSAQRVLFINAWNEWAEGAHLEPDQRYGHRYLEATRNALSRFLPNPNP